MIGNNIGDKEKHYVTKIYYMPWARAAPYLWGLVFGIIYNKIKSDSNLTEFLKSNKKLRLSLYFTGLLLIAFIMGIPRDLLKDSDAWSRLAKNIYIATSRLGIAIGFSLVVLPMMFDGEKKGVVTRILASRHMALAGKLVYNVYLHHLAFTFFKTYTSNSGFYVEKTNAFLETVCVTVISFFIAFASHITIEQSFINLEGLLMKKNK
jgi:peptidoglycan/LPS O-acetylase OafA/YrhL